MNNNALTTLLHDLVSFGFYFLVARELSFSPFEVFFLHWRALLFDRSWLKRDIFVLWEVIRWFWNPGGGWLFPTPQPVRSSNQETMRVLKRSPKGICTLGSHPQMHFSSACKRPQRTFFRLPSSLTKTNKNMNSFKTIPLYAKRYCKVILLDQHTKALFPGPRSVCLWDFSGGGIPKGLQCLQIPWKQGALFSLYFLDSAQLLQNLLEVRRQIPGEKGELIPSDTELGRISSSPFQKSQHRGKWSAYSLHYISQCYKTMCVFQQQLPWQIPAC